MLTLANLSELPGAALLTDTCVCRVCAYDGNALLLEGAHKGVGDLKSYQHLGSLL